MAKLLQTRNIIQKFKLSILTVPVGSPPTKVNRYLEIDEESDWSRKKIREKDRPYSLNRMNRF